MPNDKNSENYLGAYYHSGNDVMLRSDAPSLGGEGMPEPHVDGRYLVDSHGNVVNLHGFAQTYSPWFNEQGTKWTNYDVSGCLKYNKEKIDQILAAGWKMNFIRLHMTPSGQTAPESRPPAKTTFRHSTSTDSQNTSTRYLSLWPNTQSAKDSTS